MYIVSDLPRLLEATVILQEQWKELGEALGMSRSELDTVSSRVDSELQTKLRYLYEVLQYWVLEVGGTLNGLVGALRSISQHQLANEVERRHAGMCLLIAVWLINVFSLFTFVCACLRYTIF